MAIKLKGKVITYGNAGPYFNFLQEVKNLKDMVECGKELMEQGHAYNEEKSYEISGESVICIFEGNKGPGIILELPVKHKPYSKELKAYEKRCREHLEHYFRANQ